MSITITTDVFCDRCPLWIEGTTGSRADATGARVVAKRNGWVQRRINGKLVDLCSECAAAASKPTEGE